MCYTPIARWNVFRERLESKKVVADGLRIKNARNLNCWASDCSLETTLPWIARDLRLLARYSFNLRQQAQAHS